MRGASSPRGPRAFKLTKKTRRKLAPSATYAWRRSERDRRVKPNSNRMRPKRDQARATLADSNSYHATSATRNDAAQVWTGAIFWRASTPGTLLQREKA